MRCRVRLAYAVALAIYSGSASYAAAQEIDLAEDPVGKKSLAEVRVLLGKLAQGNASEVKLDCATMDGSTSIARIGFSLRHRHRPLEGLVLYDHTTDGEIVYNVGENKGTIKVGELKLDIHEFGKIKLQDVLKFFLEAISADLAPLAKFVGNASISIEQADFERFKRALESLREVGDDPPD